VATSSSEGGDRGNLGFGGDQDGLVTAAAAANPNTVVVAVTPGAVLMPWHASVKSILDVGMPGQEYGNALADVLFGDVNPSGRLAITLPNRENEMNFTESQYPGLDNGHNGTYSEKLLVGYRWYDAMTVQPAFPFGHGLSYTTFEYSNLQTNAGTMTVSVDVKNTGSVAGAEVAQLYLGYPRGAGEPPQQLRGFDKIQLASGASGTVTFQLRAKDFSIWDVNVHDWQLVHGVFAVYVGSSSRDIRVRGQLQI